MASRDPCELFPCPCHSSKLEIAPSLGPELLLLSMKIFSAFHAFVLSLQKGNCPLLSQLFPAFPYDIFYVFPSFETDPPKGNYALLSQLFPAFIMTTFVIAFGHFLFSL